MGKWTVSHKKQIKMMLDAVMSVMLLFLMAYQVTGEKYHEWLGAGMLILFLIHNLLNINWYKTLFQGKYSVQRFLRMVINFAVLIAIMLTGYSGIVLSHHVFTFLPIETGMATARRLHLAGSYWSFVLMSIHLGIHWSMITGRVKLKNVGLWIFQLIGIAIAFYGAILFGRNQIFHNMFLQNEFAILDYETSGILIVLQNLAMMSTWICVGHYLLQGVNRLSAGNVQIMDDTMKKNRRIQGAVGILLVVAVIIIGVISTPQSQRDLWQSADSEDFSNDTTVTEESVSESVTQDSPGNTQSENTTITASDEFVFIHGGTFSMGSPETENWRSSDEILHTVTVDDFYISAYELTQEEYEAVTGENPGTFSGDNLPIENISWLDAVTYCNLRSEQEGITPAYIIDGENVSWNLGAGGYRLPTEAEWEYAARAGTTTPFHTETSISAEEANYYGHYPYEIEGNYFEQENLTTQPGQYRETTVAVDSFSPSAWGLYNIHGNVSEWVWDYYGEYETEEASNPTGPATGKLKVYRGGGWNDFAKNMRSAYRATLEPDMGSFNIGIRLVRNAVSGPEDIVGVADKNQANDITGGNGKILITFFSWGGNTKGVAEEIQAHTGADLFEITLVNPYSSDYNTVLDQAQHDQNIQARPELANHIDNMDEYDVVMIGYPNWWASIPMPIASFLEEYDFSGKTILPFCSHGGGRFGQSLTAIAKLAPDAEMGEGLSIHYSGGSSLSADVEEWLRTNGIIE
ncbi:MAG: flavodoxin [Lachnospiraceae bacterium]|nr:flavodoxin [Lachnospiraceae bacterium]